MVQICSVCSDGSGAKSDISRLSRADYEVISYLKNSRPEMYKKLRTQAAGTGRTTTRAAVATPTKRSVSVAARA